MENKNQKAGVINTVPEMRTSGQVHGSVSQALLSGDASRILRLSVGLNHPTFSFPCVPLKGWHALREQSSMKT
jgi:hypothetical protein